MDPAEIVRRIQAHDEAGDLALYEVLQSGIRWMVTRKLGTDARNGQVDDLIHTIYAEVLERVRGAQLREPDCLCGFVATIARRATDTWIAAKVARLGGIQKLPQPVVFQRVEEKLIADERRDLMLRCLRELSPRDREILTRFYLHEEDWRSIARDMGYTPTQWRLFKNRARDRLAAAGRRLCADAEAELQQAA